MCLLSLLLPIEQLAGRKSQRTEKQAEEEGANRSRAGGHIWKTSAAQQLTAKGLSHDLRLPQNCPISKVASALLKQFIGQPEGWGAGTLPDTPRTEGEIDNSFVLFFPFNFNFNFPSHNFSSAAICHFFLFSIKYRQRQICR